MGNDLVYYVSFSRELSEKQQKDYNPFYWVDPLTLKQENTSDIDDRLKKELDFFIRKKGVYYAVFKYNNRGRKKLLKKVIKLDNEGYLVTYTNKINRMHSNTLFGHTTSLLNIIKIEVYMYMLFIQFVIQKTKDLKTNVYFDRNIFRLIFKLIF